MENYVVSGYVETGYVEGITTLDIPEVGRHPIKFFVSSGAKSEEELKSSVLGAVDDGDVVILYVPENKKIMLGAGTGFVEFMGGVDIQSIISDQTFIDKVTELANVTFNASILAGDGSVITGALVEQVDELTFNVTIPEELVGTSYNIVFDGN